MEIKDSGNRREFGTGAVRDIQEGKGRCDLMPLDVIADILGSDVLQMVSAAKENGVGYLKGAIKKFAVERKFDSEFSHTEDSYLPNSLLELAKHFEQGAVKYGENNWQKGIPVHCYIDSAVRHYLKYRAGWTDEPHDRAFVWNLVCCIWTCKHKPELNDYFVGDSDGKM